MLDIRREQTLALCAAAGVVPAHDPANDDPAFTRVRLRRDILPALQSINPAIVPAPGRAGRRRGHRSRPAR